MNLTEFMRNYKLSRETPIEPVFVKPPKIPKPPKPPKQVVDKKPRIKIFKPPKVGKTKIEKKRKDIEKRLAYNENRANQFRELIMQNNILDPLVSKVQMSP